MNIHWGSFWLGVGAFPVAAVIVCVLAVLIMRALSRNTGSGGCAVCDEAFTCDTGECTRAYIWIRNRRHNWFISTRKWHRDAWARCRWNPYRLPGYPRDNMQAAIRRQKPSLIRRAWWFIVD